VKSEGLCRECSLKEGTFLGENPERKFIRRQTRVKKEEEGGYDGGGPHQKKKENRACWALIVETSGGKGEGYPRRVRRAVPEGREKKRKASTIIQGIGNFRRDVFLRMRRKVKQRSIRLQCSLDRRKQGKFMAKP